MLINPPEEWKKENINGEADRTSTEQVPNKLAEQVSDAERILIMSIGEQELSMKQIMEATGKMHRPSLLYNYIKKPPFQTLYTKHSHQLFDVLEHGGSAPFSTFLGPHLLVL